MVVIGFLQIQSARLAQSVERWTLNPTVVGSSPTLGVFFSKLNSKKKYTSLFRPITTFCKLTQVSNSPSISVNSKLISTFPLFWRSKIENYAVIKTKYHKVSHTQISWNVIIFNSHVQYFTDSFFFTC